LPSGTNGNKFIFSSEIKALLGTKLFKPEADIESIQDYMVFQAVLGEKTLFNDVNRLMPGYHMTVDRHGSIVSKKQYWCPRFETDYSHDEDYFVDHLQMLLRDAVKIRLRSDVPLGAHLSGGLDSSTVVCLANELNGSGEPLTTFTGGFDEGASYDETRYAALLAEKTGARYMEIRPTVEDFREHIQKIIYFMDEPAAGPGLFPQYMVSKLASENVKVVLGGQGGDEIFAGYTRYLVGYLEECLKGAIEETDKTAHYAATLSTIIPSLPMLQQYMPMLRYFWAEGLFEPMEDRYFRLMDRSAGVRDIYSPEVSDDGGRVLGEFKDIFDGSDALSFLNRMLFFDLKVHLPALLHVEDRTSMAWGLESRVPLLDHRIVELIASTPTTIKFKNGHPKYLFRKAIKNIIPEEILHRKDKMGFPVPLHLWLKGPLRDFARDIVLSDRAKGRGIYNHKVLEAAIEKEKDFGRAIWGVLCMELWFSTFIDQ
jgi:asparagine synthase (glutamine-hydrolysing)